MRRYVSGAIYALSTLVGVLSFIYPFFLDAPATSTIGVAHGQEAPILTMGLAVLSFLALLVELQGQAISAKTVAMLGVLVAVSSVLRFVEVAVPMPGGFSPIFAPIILAGYAFGGRFGFLMGVFTLMVSGLITGGVGPWLPYQMYGAGWVGMTAGWAGSAVRRVFGADRSQQLDVFILALFGFCWGILFGVIINIYFWPFAVGPLEQTWTPGIRIGEILARYGAFYVVTSLGWDVVRAVGNAALVLLLGAPTLRALERFRQRFHFEVRHGNA